ncbi:MAG: DUF456 domain-containing protein [Anaerolineae bacterium]|nr:DUF456 domain-containing protein [Anaerolineae bacterium]
MAAALMVVGFVLMFVGLIGAIIPNFPDSVLIVVGALLLTAADGLTWSDGVLVGAVVLIALAAEGLVYLAQAYGAKRAGASWKGVVGAILGGVLGLFFLQPVGILIGPIVGAVAGELIGGKQGGEAFKAGLGALVGTLGGVVLKFAAAVTMVGLVVLSLFL